MSKKISELTSAALPLSGQETVVMNQNGSTVTSSLSNVKTYIASTTFTSISTTDVKLNGSIILKGYNTNVMIGPVLTADQPGNYTMTGNNNILIGEDCGKDITSGDNNICLGKDSGNSITSASDNILLGKDAGNVITGGGGNVCIGTQSGRYMTSMSNTCVGSGAGQGNSTSIGIGNVCLGYATNASSGFVNGTIVIGYAANALHDDSIVLGQYAQTTKSNQLVLGSTLYPLVTASSGTNTGKFLEILLNGQLIKIPIYT